MPASRLTRPTPARFGPQPDMSDAPSPYRTTPVFDETSLPAALKREHSTKAGVWGVIRVLEGRLRLVHLDPVREESLSTSRPGLILPERTHYVRPDDRKSTRLTSS